MDFYAIHHVAVIASSYEQAKAFYVGALGLRLLRDTARPDKGDRKLDLALPGGAELELFIKPDSPARPNWPEALGLRHLAFAVKDVDVAAAELAGKGIPVEPVRLDPLTGKRTAFFFDPDGLPLELYEV
ncbi:MAG: VOC family protein [Clostridia bacterium]|nr:VOC family protein [Clostridia bacterium]